MKFFYRELQDGTLIMDNGIVEGSKVVLTPNVETGLLVSEILLFFNDFGNYLLNPI